MNLNNFLNFLQGQLRHMSSLAASFRRPCFRPILFAEFYVGGRVLLTGAKQPRILSGPGTVSTLRGFFRRGEARSQPRIFI
jgi:hypothetical protein